MTPLILTVFRIQVHVGMLNDSVLELKGLLHGLLRRDERGMNNNNNSIDDVTDDAGDRSTDEYRLNLVNDNFWVSVSSYSSAPIVLIMSN